MAPDTQPTPARNASTASSSLTLRPLSSDHTTGSNQQVLAPTLTVSGEQPAIPGLSTVSLAQPISTWEAVYAENKANATAENAKRARSPLSPQMSSSNGPTGKKQRTMSSSGLAAVSRLNELGQKRSIAIEFTYSSPAEQLFFAAVKLTDKDGYTIYSSPEDVDESDLYPFPSKKLAKEHAANQALASLLEMSPPPAAEVEVEHNHVSQLFEMCAKHRLPLPSFTYESRSANNVMRFGGTCTFNVRKVSDGTTVEKVSQSPTTFATKKAAKQAAAAAAIAIFNEGNDHGKAEAPEKQTDTVVVPPS